MAHSRLKSAVRAATAGAFVALALLVGAPVRADVWGFVDEKGVPHFASERLDDRYELFFRNTETFDTTRDPPPAVEAEAVPATVPAPVAPSKLMAFFEVSPSLSLVRQHMRDASSDHNIDFELLQALIAAESGFNTTAVSPKGAIGLMQIMPATARRYGVDGDRKMAIERKLVDPKINIKTGTRYLRRDRNSGHPKRLLLDNEIIFDEAGLARGRANRHIPYIFHPVIADGDVCKPFPGAVPRRNGNPPTPLPGSPHRLMHIIPFNHHIPQNTMPHQ